MSSQEASLFSSLFEHSYGWLRKAWQILRLQGVSCIATPIGTFDGLEVKGVWDEVILLFQ